MDDRRLVQQVRAAMEAAFCQLDGAAVTEEPGGRVLASWRAWVAVATARISTDGLPVVDVDFAHRQSGWQPPQEREPLRDVAALLRALGSAVDAMRAFAVVYFGAASDRLARLYRSWLERRPGQWRQLGFSVFMVGPAPTASEGLWEAWRRACRDE